MITRVLVAQEKQLPLNRVCVSGSLIKVATEGCPNMYGLVMHVSCEEPTLRTTHQMDSGSSSVT